ncbi:amidohydrolase family protein [Pseudomonas aeruginosa]|nr:amidohydrolase family protein [Pseudomonas aeruginosa]
MKRREFVIGAGALAGASLLTDCLPALAAPESASTLPADDQAAAARRPAAGRIDVHQHLLPPFYVEALRRQGMERMAGVPLPQWTAERSLALLDAQGMQAAILSLPAPAASFGEPTAATELARRCNEYAAELMQQHPDRFGSFAALPLPATEAACAEALHALDALKADGVQLLASSQGVFLGDPRFDELMAELDRRNATVQVHANLHPSSQTLALDTPGFVLELACDISRAAVNLILSGTLERYPRIRWILANAGGYLPYAAWRVSLANAFPEFQDRAPLGVMSYLQRFYFDTALAPGAPSMAVLRELVESRQLLFGSDFPLAPASLVAQQLTETDTASPWSPRQLSGIARGHALSLFPRFAAPGENVVAAPKYESESALHRLGRNATQPLASLLQRLKD